MTRHHDPHKPAARLWCRLFHRRHLYSNVGGHWHWFAGICWHVTLYEPIHCKRCQS